MDEQTKHRALHFIHSHLRETIGHDQIEEKLKDGVVLFRLLSTLKETLPSSPLTATLSNFISLHSTPYNKLDIESILLTISSSNTIPSPTSSSEKSPILDLSMYKASKKHTPKKTSPIINKSFYDEEGTKKIIRKVKSKLTILGDHEDEVLAHYQLGNCIGKGQFGLVYKALDLETGEVTAIKRIDLIDQDEKGVEEFMKEITILQSLSHPNIVQYIGFINEDGFINLILEYVENGSLLSLMKTFTVIPESLAIKYIIQVLEGLIYLHERGVIHCDLKAANILTTKGGDVKLSDFGVSKQLMLNKEGTCNSVVGTPNWMAPEIITLKGATTASDIWSLGCTIIEIITGSPPYNDMNSMSALFKIVEDENGPELPINFSDDLKDFLGLCFKKDPELRPSAPELMQHAWIQKNKLIRKRHQSFTSSTLTPTIQFPISSASVPTSSTLKMYPSNEDETETYTTTVTSFTNYLSKKTYTNREFSRRTSYSCTREEFLAADEEMIVVDVFEGRRRGSFDASKKKKKRFSKLGAFCEEGGRKSDVADAVVTRNHVTSSAPMLQMGIIDDGGKKKKRKKRRGDKGCIVQ